MIARRSFLTGAAALFCAPAIVRATNIMPVRPARFLFDGFESSFPWNVPYDQDVISQIAEMLCQQDEILLRLEWREG